MHLTLFGMISREERSRPSTMKWIRQLEDQSAVVESSRFAPSVAGDRAMVAGSVLPGMAVRSYALLARIVVHFISDIQ